MRHTNRERPSTRLSIANTVFRRELNGRAFLSDPDVFFLRENNLKLTEEQKLIVATVNALFGGVYFCSDNMGRYDLEKRALYRRLLETRCAEGIRVEADTPGLVSVTFKVGGVHKLLKIKI
jgi:alpha-galactosidase